MIKRNIKGRSKGITLVELMVSLGLGLILVFSMLVFYGALIKKINARSQAEIKYQEYRNRLNLFRNAFRNVGAFTCQELPKEIPSFIAVSPYTVVGFRPVLDGEESYRNLRTEVLYGNDQISTIPSSGAVYIQSLLEMEPSSCPGGIREFIEPVVFAIQPMYFPSSISSVSQKGGVMGPILPTSTRGLSGPGGDDGPGEPGGVEEGGGGWVGVGSSAGESSILVKDNNEPSGMRSIGTDFVIVTESDNLFFPVSNSSFTKSPAADKILVEKIPEGKDSGLKAYAPVDISVSNWWQMDKTSTFIGGYSVYENAGSPGLYNMQDYASGFGLLSPETSSSEKLESRDHRINVYIGFEPKTRDTGSESGYDLVTVRNISCNGTAEERLADIDDGGWLLLADVAKCEAELLESESLYLSRSEVGRVAPRFLKPEYAKKVRALKYIEELDEGNSLVRVVRLQTHLKKVNELIEEAGDN